jgi:pimeloyl-ACP methyl ester carboxylesterase
MAALTPSKLWSWERGEGPQLLLIAGLGGSSWIWRELAEELDGRRAIGFDNRGTGQSPGPARTTVAALAEDAAAVLEAHGGGPADLLGFSMGGYVALTLALAEPSLVRSLVLVGTGGGGPGRVPRPRHVADAFTEALGLPHEEFARRTMPYTLAPGWAEANPGRFEALLAARLEHPTPYETLEAHAAACYAFYADGCAAEELRLPALVVHGDQDLIVPVDNGRLLAGRLPCADYVELAGRGHHVMLEAAGELGRLVGGFLARVS